MRKSPLTLVKISRKKWYYGQGGDAVDSALIIDKENFAPNATKACRKTNLGKQCCLGFAARALGMNPFELKGRATPTDVQKDFIVPKRFVKTFLDEEVRNPNIPKTYYHNNKVVNQMMVLNDSTSHTRREKEAQLKPLARQIGFKFVFVP